MSRFLVSAALVLMSLCFSGNLSAANFGVVGGANFHTYNPRNIGTQTLASWHAGIAGKFSLPLGFQLQPSLLYNVKNATTKDAPLDLSVGYLEFLASVQWGVDLILFRPFLEVSPFAGYGINGWGSIKDMWAREENRWEYGIGLGGGLQIWRFQVNARYNWNFNWMDFSGVTLSLTYFF